MKKIAVLGGSRFIGFHLVWALHKQGHDVTIFNRQITPPPGPFPKGIHFVRGDRNNPEDLKGLFNKTFDVVFHISGFTPRHLEPIIQNYRSCIRHYIFVSSTSVYQKPPVNPLNEAIPCVLTENTRGRDKLLAEAVLFKEYMENNLPVTIFRPQGVFGPYDACCAGLIFYRLLHALPLLIFKGTNKRVNFLYIDDLVHAFLLSMNNPKTYGAVYTVAGDDIVTPETFIMLCGKVSSIVPEIKYVDKPAFYERGPGKEGKRFVSVGIPWPKYDQVVDNSKIKKELGLTFTDLETALKKTLSWLSEKPAHLNYFALRAERYILSGRPIPLGVKASWVLTDALKNLARHSYDTMKRIQWLRSSVRYLKRILWSMRLKHT